MSGNLYLPTDQFLSSCNYDIQLTGGGDFKWVLVPMAQDGTQGPAPNIYCHVCGVLVVVELD